MPHLAVAIGVGSARLGLSRAARIGRWLVIGRSVTCHDSYVGSGAAPVEPGRADLPPPNGMDWWGWVGVAVGLGCMCGCLCGKS